MSNTRSNFLRFKLTSGDKREYEPKARTNKFNETSKLLKLQTA